MSLRAVIEIALHFESFRNIDLFHQGLYHLKARLRQDGGSSGSGSGGTATGSPSVNTQQPSQQQAPIAACPVGSLALEALPSDGAKPGARQSTRPDHHNLIPAHVIEDQATFSTRSFLIRYCEEEVEMNDIGQFRWEISTQDAAKGSVPSLILEVDLMFADLAQHGGADRFGESPDVDSTEFKCVSTARFRLRRLAQGMHEFVPVVFDEFHCCVAHCMIHSALLDYRLRLQPNAQLASIAADGEAEDAAVEGSPRVSQVPLAPPAGLSFAECLFGPDAAIESRDQLLQRAEGIYQKHLDALAASHEKLTSWFKQVCEDCLTPMQREILVGAEVGSPIAKSPAASGDSLSTACTDANGLPTQYRRYLELKLGPRISPRALAGHLSYDLNAAACRVIETWHRALSVLLHAPREVALSLRLPWETYTSRRWASTIVKEPPRADVAETTTEDSCSSHSTMAESLRKQARDLDKEVEDELAVQDLSGIWSMEARPLIFEERYLGGGAAAPRIARSAGDANRRPSRPAPTQPSSGSSASAASASPPPSQEDDDCPPSAPKQYIGVHLIVLVHGFQGNSYDMRLMKNNLAMLYPDAIFLASACNEDNTEGDINEMGVRLAQEVVNYICDWCPSGALGRLSFITHSLGGLIARAALPLLQEYSSKMFTFLTFSSCHLGIFQDRISLFNTGFWVLKKWRQSVFLTQVSMGDHDNPRETFLYKLSKARGLESFQHIAFASCFEDQYGPLQSARAEICPEWDAQPDKEVYREMVENMWAVVRPERVRRLDVNFVISENNLDAFIGRTAHIQFLECQQLMRMLVHNYSALFR